MATHILIRTHTDFDRTWSEGDVIAVAVGRSMRDPPFSDNELKINVLIVLNEDVTDDIILKWTEQNTVTDERLDDPVTVLNARKYFVNLRNLIDTNRIKKGKSSNIDATENHVRDRVTKTRSEEHSSSIVKQKILDITRG